MTALHRAIASCRECSAHFPHDPRPVVQFSSTSRLLIIGQAPGSKVHESGIPWQDASGQRLLEWTGLENDQLHDPSLVALVPMGFCYPGKGNSGDLPPREECAPLWHGKIVSALPQSRLTLLVGNYAQSHYLPEMRSLTMTDKISRWRELLPDTVLLPHPSWRSRFWINQNPWFEAEVLPELRRLVARALA